MFRDDPRIPQSNILANVLLNGINAGLFQAYTITDKHAADVLKEEDLREERVDPGKPMTDTNFTTVIPLTKEEVHKIIACDPTGLSINTKRYINFCAAHKNDSIEFLVEDYGTKKRKKNREEEKPIALYDTSAVQSCVYPQQIDHYGIIEDWIFDKGREQMVVRIVAIAPMVHWQPLFWVLYPEIRKYMAQYEVYNETEPEAARYTWDEYFESRQFSSKITKLRGGPESFTY